jgi:hypothetical protein
MSDWWSNPWGWDSLNSQSFSAWETSGRPEAVRWSKSLQFPQEKFACLSIIFPIANLRTGQQWASWRCCIVTQCARFIHSSLNIPQIWWIQAMEVWLRIRVDVRSMKTEWLCHMFRLNGSLIDVICNPIEIWANKLLRRPESSIHMFAIGKWWFLTERSGFCVWNYSKNDCRGIGHSLSVIMLSTQCHIHPRYSTERKEDSWIFV